MQANLVFGPFTAPCAPLGIAGIKSYVEKNSDFNIKCFDFNALYLNDIINDMRNGTSQIETSAEDKAVILKAADTFKNKNGEFFNQTVYISSAATLFDACFTSLNNFFRDECTKAISKTASTPWFVKKYVEILLLNKPDVIGFSIMFPEQVPFAILAAQMLKAADKNIKIVFGGQSSTAAYKWLLSYPAVDFIALNEGEKAFLDLLTALGGGKYLKQVPNIAFRDAGKIRVTKDSVISELDSLPFPDFSDFDLNSYFTPEPVVCVLGSRGCYWRRCAFCIHYKSYFNRYRTASVEHIVDEMEYHLGNGVKYFDFVDEMIPAGRFKQIGEEIIRRNLQVYYYALAKPTSDFTREVFDVMYKSGCRYILWGAESGCQRILDLIDKGTKVADMSKVMQDSASAGLKNHLFIIIGFPSETEQELRATMDFLYENRDSIHAVHYGTFELHRDTPIYASPAKYHISKIYPDSVSFSIDSIKYDVSQGLSHKDAERYNEFYSRNYFEYFNYFAGHLRALRHHALVMYANDSKLIINTEKKPVPAPVLLKGNL